jgi:hypothetical protein
MTRTIGIIPAGGTAARFNGLSKELLPVSPHDCALTRCIKSMQIGGAEDIYIATRPDKTVEHWRTVESFRGVHLTARSFQGLWEFIAHVGESTQASRYFFAMPDTVYPIDAFSREFTMSEVWHATAGVFLTDKPGRFGILAGNSIIDKDPKLTGYAWGVWIWSREAMTALSAACRETKDHTKALNKVISQFGINTFLLDHYYDFAAFDDYLEFLCSLT